MFNNLGGNSSEFTSFEEGIPANPPLGSSLIFMYLFHLINPLSLSSPIGIPTLSHAVAIAFSPLVAFSI